MASYSDSINLRSHKFQYGGCYLNQGPKTSKFVKICTDLTVLHSELLLLMIVKLIFFDQVALKGGNKY